jgi:hypothetical protein
MKAAKNIPTPRRKYSLKASMHQLKELMRKPMKPMRVVVVDDDDEAVDGIIPILLNWPNIFSVTIIHSGKQYPDILGGRDDIVLLDDLDGNTENHINGERIVQWLREDGFPGIIASISSEFVSYPNCEHHFPHKYRIVHSFKAGGTFILWLNQLIFEVESDR